MEGSFPEKRKFIKKRGGVGGGGGGNPERSYLWDARNRFDLEALWLGRISTNTRTIPNCVTL